MKIFVTGATGFIGGKTVEQLLARHEVRALVRTPAKAKHLEELGVDLVPGDLTDRASLEKGMEGVDAVIHGAAYYEIGPIDQEFMTRVNVEGTRNVLEVAKERKIPRVVYISSIASKGDTGGQIATEAFEHKGNFPSHYEWTKYEAHRVARALAQGGLPLRIAMPGVVYGPKDHSAIGAYIRDYVQGRLPARVGEDTVQSFVYVEDVADGIVKVLEAGQDSEEYLLSGYPHSFQELNQALQKLSRVRPPFLAMPIFLARMYAKASEAYGRLLGRKVLVTQEGVENLNAKCYAYDCRKAVTELKWKPRTLEEGLVPTLQALGVSVPTPGS